VSDLVVHDLTKRYGGGAGIEAIDLAAAPGELLALVGPSGCGKSTLLRTIAGLTAPDRGRVQVDGRDVTDLPPERRSTVMLFQQPLLFPHLTVAGNVAFSLRLRGADRREAAATVAGALRTVQLEGLDHRYPDQLSGGQQQRVALARALAAAPQVLLLDEPFSALDAPLRAEMRELLRRLQRQRSLTMLFVTHDQEEASLLGDRIAVMQAGRLRQIGAAADLYDRPASEVVARFFGGAALVPGRVIEGQCFTEVGPFPANGATGGDVLAVIRADQVILQPWRAGQPEARILDVHFAGGLLLAQVECAGVVLQARLQVHPGFALAPGQPVALRIQGPVWCLKEEVDRCPSPLTLSAD
jgi:ABC-type Fe3+/spermidine/putrescine transport system ATPase subunit